MKIFISFFLVAIYALAQGCANTQFNDHLNAISNEIANSRESSRNTQSLYSGHANKTHDLLPPGDMRWCLKVQPVVSNLHVDLNKTPTIEAFCQEFRNKNTQYPQCYEDCETRFTADFNIIKEKKEQRELAEQQANATRLAQQEEAERKAASDKQELEALNRDLVSGRVKPTNLDQAIIAFDAGDGESIAKSPKLRPDGQLYALSGSISAAEDGVAVFFGEITTWRASLIPIKEFNYIGVRIPDGLHDYYFNNARINGRFDLVGRYIENSTYKTTLGANETIPVFDAVYLGIR